MTTTEQRRLPNAASSTVPEPRLVVPEARTVRLALDGERARGTYAPQRCADVLTELEDAGLRGRGGAAYPAHRKWRSVSAAPGPKVVVANGEEGEPTSYKDRWLLTHRPHLVLDGLLLAAATVGAEQAVMYLSHPETAASVNAAITELRGTDVVADLPTLAVHTVSPTYVAGEETAACRSINGGSALPLSKPPRPFESGVAGRPTLVSNVETLAHAAWIARHGAGAYRRRGTAASPGTTLVTLAGACARPGVYEVPFGWTLNELFENVGGGFTSTPQGFAMGGWFGGVLGPHRAHTVCCYDAVQDVGSGLGCAAITALGADDDPLAVAADIARWYAGESAQQCGVCMKGTAAIRDTLQNLRDGHAGSAERDKLTRWGDSLPGRGACAFLNGAATWARTVVTELSEHVDARLVTDEHSRTGPDSQGGER